MNTHRMPTDRQRRRVEGLVLAWLLFVAFDQLHGWPEGAGLAAALLGVATHFLLRRVEAAHGYGWPVYVAAGYALGSVSLALFGATFSMLDETLRVPETLVSRWQLDYWNYAFSATVTVWLVHRPLTLVFGVALPVVTFGVLLVGAVILRHSYVTYGIGDGSVMLGTGFRALMTAACMMFAAYLFDVMQRERVQHGSLATSPSDGHDPRASNPYAG